jgi:hypothetical protein
VAFQEGLALLLLLLLVVMGTDMAASSLLLVDAAKSEERPMVLDGTAAPGPTCDKGAAGLPSWPAVLPAADMALPLLLLLLLGMVAAALAPGAASMLVSAAFSGAPASVIAGGRWHTHIHLRWHSAAMCQGVQQGVAVAGSHQLACLT